MCFNIADGGNAEEKVGFCLSVFITHRDFGFWGGLDWWDIRILVEQC